jgi:hypothetical protein
MATTKTKKAFIISTFNDTGTEQHFTAGSVVDLPEGVFGNYEAAGLVRAPTADDKAAKDA